MFFWNIWTPPHYWHIVSYVFKLRSSVMWHHLCDYQHSGEPATSILSVEEKNKCWCLIIIVHSIILQKNVTFILTDLRTLNVFYVYLFIFNNVVNSSDCVVSIGMRSIEWCITVYVKESSWELNTKLSWHLPKRCKEICGTC